MPNEHPYSLITLSRQFVFSYPHILSSQWAHILKKNMTNDEIAAVGYKKWKWGNTEVANYMLDTAIMGEYFHIYRSFWRSHMCAIDGRYHIANLSSHPHYTLSAHPLVTRPYHIPFHHTTSLPPLLITPHLASTHRWQAQVPEMSRVLRPRFNPLRGLHMPGKR